MQKNLSFQNKKLQYRVMGEGQPVVLVHGFGEDQQVWDHQTENLAKRFMLILPDLPGSGGSELADDVSMENLAEAIHAILMQEKLETVVMMGHSMGGYVTLAFAEKYPNMLRAFALVHSTAYPDTEEKITTRRKAIEFMRRNGAKEFIKNSSPNLFSAETKQERPDLVETLTNLYKDMDVHALIAYYEAMIKRPDRTHVLKEFNRPILFLAGEQDSAIPYDQVVQQSALPLLSYLHALHRSGHMGMWEEPKESGLILEEFVKNNVL
ncbi:MAG: alpha/beta hydrolase [Chitinophagaceae bacterium]